MGFSWNSPLADYGKAIRSAPREVVTNRRLILSAMLYATAAVPTTWDQGSASVIPSLPGFQRQFGITSGANPTQIKNFVSIVYLGLAAGAASSFFINDRIGRRWSFRLYTLIYIVGQLIATLAPNLAALYASRIVSGWGIGALTVVGPMSLAEIAPREIRGLLTSWFNVAMGTALTSAIFCVYGTYIHVGATTKLQYQVVFFAPCVFMALVVAGTFLWMRESPRWLFLVDRHDEAVAELVRLRGLPTDHPRMQQELNEIQDSIRRERMVYGDTPAGTPANESSPGLSFWAIVKETFTVPANLRRVQLTLVSYALAQLSGANSVTSYFVPILTLMGLGGDTLHNIFLSGMYGMAKFFFTLFASFFVIDTLGRRKSLFIGASLQMISDLYIGVYIKYKQAGNVLDTASRGAIAFIFLHALGYMLGLFILPYVFGSEVWPNHIRSFGGALSSCFHWLFIYAMAYGTPSLLAKMNNWGAFIFFATWCFLSIVYVFVMVPETAGLSVEEIDGIFKGPWFSAWRPNSDVAESIRRGDYEDADDDDKVIAGVVADKKDGGRLSREQSKGTMERNRD